MRNQSTEKFYRERTNHSELLYTLYFILTEKIPQQHQKSKSDNVSKSKTSKRQSKYPNKDRRAIVDALSYRGGKLPILKNAKSQDSGVQFNLKKYTFEQTCAIDSLYHLLLAGCTDNENLNDHVSTTHLLIIAYFFT